MLDPFTFSSLPLSAVHMLMNSLEASAVWGHAELSLGRRYATVDVPTLQFTQNFHIKTLSVEEVAKEQRNYLFSRPLEILL